MAFNIELIFEDGRPVRINGGTKLYLPFPPGKTIEDCRAMNFTIRHDASDGTYWYRTENNDIKVTPHGLMIFIDSLSPFTITWSQPPVHDDLPKTGDDSMLWLYAGLLAVSCLCLMLRRKHA